MTFLLLILPLVTVVSAVVEIPLEESLRSETNSARSKRMVSLPRQKWKGNTLYYEIDSSIDFNRKELVDKAMDFISTSTCVNFEQHKGQANYAVIIGGNKCESEMGIKGGKQNINLGVKCANNLKTVMHELFHALGFDHTHQRSDRNNYITVNTSGLNRESKSDYIANDKRTNILFVPYEYRSIMHYGYGYEIQPLDSRYIHGMGDKLTATFYDIKMVNDYYCNDSCPTSAKCANGGYPHPRKCNTCICPLGYGGGLCEQRPTGCGDTLKATSNWKTKEISVGNVFNSNQRDIESCNDWITAPFGRQVEIRIKNVICKGCYCPGQFCSNLGVEIKTDKDQGLSNPIYCCPHHFPNESFVSQLNPTPIITFTTDKFLSYTLEYRHVTPRPVTTRPPPSTTPSDSSCVNDAGDELCEKYVIYDNICETYPWRDRKSMCAKTCGLCGQAPTPCVDVDRYRCPRFREQGNCEDPDTIKWTPYKEEYYCPETCGYCKNPL